MAEKTEKATPKKLRDARKKGQVAKAQDLPSAFTFMGSVGVVLALATLMYKELSQFITEIFTSAHKEDLSTLIIAFFYRAIEVSFLVSIPVLLFVAGIGVLVTFLTVGPTFSPEAMKFDLKKLNPIQNLKAKFKIKTLVELVKSCAKIAIAGYIIYRIMRSSLAPLTQATSMDAASSAALFAAFLWEVVIKVGLFFLAIAILDFFYQRKTFAKEMMMEKFEVKQEYKNTEGNPEIKGKRRQIAQEIVYQDGPIKSIRRSQAVVTNPTHLAIAIGYQDGVDAAPYILAMGQDHLAAQMIKIAEEYRIPVLRNIPLAHTLWENGEIDQYVPEETYEALAEVLRWVRLLKQDEAS